MKRSCLWRATCALLLTLLATNSQASIVVPAGLNPGDTYHVIFVTSTGINALSSDIATYDTFAQDIADSTSIGASIGISWYAVASTPTVSAYNHLASIFSSTSNVPIYNQNGDLVSSSFDGLWDSVLDSPVLYDESANVFAGLAWTGTQPDGSGDPGLELGSGGGGVTVGASSSTTGIWMDRAIAGNTIQYSLYALSDTITISAVPIPAAFWLFGSGLLGLIGVARHKKT